MYLLLVLCCISVTVSQYQLVPRGKKFSEDPTKEYKLYLSEAGSGRILSYWHDVPLLTKSDSTNKTYNLIVEIPRFSQAKFEIHREHLMNPIVQDREDNHLRYVPNVFPWHGHVCNYGAFPQTWENPFHADEWTGLKGDKDPIDVCEVGSKPVDTGTVLPVKVLGILGLLDGGETDWKVIVMNSVEADKENINNLDNLRSKKPGVLEAVRKFFTVYKVPAGKPENVFAYNGEVKDAALAVEVIKYTHDAWKEMISNCSIRGDTVGTFNTGNTLQGTPCTVEINKAKEEVNSMPVFDPQDAELPGSVDDWSFLPASGSGLGLERFILLVSLVLFKV